MTTLFDTLIVPTSRTHFFLFRSVAVRGDVKISDCSSEGTLISKVIDRLLRMHKLDVSAVI